MALLSAAWRRRLGIAVKVAVSLAVLLLVATRVDLHGVVRNMLAASPAALLLAFVAFLAIPPFGGLRWWLALRGLGVCGRYASLTTLFSAALVVGQVLPSVAGDGVRVLMATRRGIGLAAAVHSVFLERLTTVLMLLALAVATAPLLAFRTGSAGPAWVFALLLAAGLAGLGVLMVADRILPALARFPVWRALTGLSAATRRLVLSRWGMGLWPVGLLSNLNFVVAAWLLARALALPVSAMDCLALMPPVLLASILPISFGGWGVREGALVVLFGSIGVPAADALALSLLFGVFGALSGLPGLLAWSLERRDDAPQGQPSGRPGIARAP